MNRSSNWNRLYGFEGYRWVAYFWFVGWDCFSLGFHVCASAPNVEIHVPFGFVRFGRHSNSRPNPYRTCSGCDKWSTYRTTDPDSKTLIANCYLHNAPKRGSDKCSKWIRKVPEPVCDEYGYC